MLEHLSVSKINMLRRCMKQYEFRYLKNIVIPPPGAVIAGKSYHEALAATFNHQVITGEQLPINDVVDVFDTAWNQQVTSHTSTDEDEPFVFNEIDWKDDPGKIKDTAIILTRGYCQSMAPKVKPVTVEEKKLVNVAVNDKEIPVMMVLDVTTDLAIIDHKLKKKRFSVDDLANDLQPTAYLLQDPTKVFHYHLALDQKIPIVEDVMVTRDQKDFNFFTDSLPTYWQLIEAGNFPPTGNGWACSETWCGYWKFCKGK